MGRTSGGLGVSKPQVRNSHGGKRRGAGRPHKWSFWFIVEVGQACENLNRKAIEESLKQQKNDLFRQQTELEWLWARINKIPICKRSQFLAGEALEVHSKDIEAEVNLISSGKKLTRIVQFRTKAPRGTRKDILKKIADQFDLTTTQVDNLWQQYRRLENEENN